MTTTTNLTTSIKMHSSMKRLDILSILAAAAVVVSCEFSEPIRPYDETEELPAYTGDLSDIEWSTFVFTSDSNEEESKTEHSGSTIIWSAGDQIRMGYTVATKWQGANGNANNNSPAKLYASDALTSGGETASFSVPGQFPSTGSGEYKFYTVYPASAVAENFSNAPSTVVTIPTEQTPAEASFDPAADIMVGHSVKSYNAKPTEAIPLMWDRLVAHGEITLKNLSNISGFSADETIQSVTLTAQTGAYLTGSYNLNVTTPAIVSSNSASNSVSVSGDNLSWNNGTLTFWIGILPVTMTSLEVTLETDAAIYTRSFTGITREFLGNTHNKLGINMASATRTQKAYVLVESSLTDWSGDYVLAYTYSGTNYAMSGQNGSNNYSSVVNNITISDKSISLTQGSPLNVRIDKSTNGYTLKFGNYYLGYTSTATSGNNNLYYSSTFEANKYEWTLEFVSDGNKVKIKNVYNTSRYLQLNNNQKDRFAAYTGSMWNPQLYRLGESSGGSTPLPQPEATATVTTVAADNIAQTTATLNGTYTGATGAISEVGFYYGTSSTPSTKVVSNGTSSPFTSSLSGLTANTTYYFQAYVKEYNASTSSVEERKGLVLNFTTEAEPQTGGDYELVTASQSDWSGAYVMANTDANMMLTGVTTIGTVSSVTISNNKISYSAGSPYEITIAKSGSYYTLYLTGVGYLGWTSGNSLAFASSASDNSYKWSISYSSGALTIANAGDSTRKLQYNSGSPRFACYTSSQKAPQLFKRGTSTPQVTVTTGSASSIANTSATLNGSYVVPTGLTVTERGFYFGSGSNPSTKITVSGTGTSFSYSKTGLTLGSSYSYKAYAIESDGTTTTTRYGEVVYFTTTGGTNVPTGWLELPATTGNEDYVGTFYGSGGNTEDNRNYTYYYNYTYYASMWVAYPLTKAHTQGSQSSSWAWNPNIDQSYQINMTGSSYPTMYGAQNYSKGHQCPNADRKSDATMNSQTYYCTNQTPQIQNGFNGSIWGNLESGIRSLLTSNDDIVYIATGPVYQKVGGNEEITYLHAASGKNASPESVPVPNYYWKAILKVKKSGDSITSASAIGFWFEHKVYASGTSYTNYAVSVDQIETWTGFDLFTNLPDGIEATAEANTSWSTFQSF